MNKLNETITGLVKIRANLEDERDFTGIRCINNVIELLKEQNSLMLALDQSNSANEYLNEEVDKLNALLRQQQDEIAILTKKAKSPTWRRGKAFCGSCGGCLENKEKHSADIVSSIRFCKWCGTPVDWSNE